MESWRSFSEKTLNEVNLLDLERDLDAPDYAKMYQDSQESDLARKVNQGAPSVPSPGGSGDLEKLEDRIERLIGSEGSSGQIADMDYDALGQLSDRVNASGEGRTAETLKAKGVKPLSQSEITNLATASDEEFQDELMDILGGKGSDLSAIDRDGDGAISADQLRNIANSIDKE